MRVDPVNGLDLREMREQPSIKSSRGEGCPRGCKRAGKFKGLLEQEEDERDESIEEFDELDTNQDGIVDDSELQAAGISPGGEFQTTENLLALLISSNKEE